MNIGNVSRNITRALPVESFKKNWGWKESPRAAVMIQLPQHHPGCQMFVSPRAGADRWKEKAMVIRAQPYHFKRIYSKSNWTEAFQWTKWTLGTNEDKPIFTTRLVLITEMQLLHPYRMLCWYMILVSFPDHEHHCQGRVYTGTPALPWPPCPGGYWCGLVSIFFGPAPESVTPENGDKTCKTRWMICRSRALKKSSGYTHEFLVSCHTYYLGMPALGWARPGNWEKGKDFNGENAIV